MLRSLAMTQIFFRSLRHTTMPTNRSLSDRLAAFPHLGLATLPTPLEPMNRLTAHLGGAPALFAYQSGLGI